MGQLNYTLCRVAYLCAMWVELDRGRDASLSRPTPRFGHAPTPMRLVDRGSVPNHCTPLDRVGDFYLIRYRERYWRNHPKTDWYWKQEGVGPDAVILVLALPCVGSHRNPVGGVGWIYNEWTINHKNDCDASWTWDGNEQKPTLSPSLHDVGIWHGWVQAGMLKEA